MAALCPHFFTTASSLIFFVLPLLLLPESSGTTELVTGRTRSGQEGQPGADGRFQLQGGDGEPETGFGDAATGGGGAAVEARGLWRDPGPAEGRDGLWEPRSSSRCVPVPPGMALCQNIGYDTMRMPNLLGHESPAEAVQQSASWLPLLARECHPDARIFLCSLFAPICLDRFISPCRSLCESVRDSCAPIMSCYGYPWPDILRCDQYPADHLMCISSVTNSSAAEARRVPQASCRDCELEEAPPPKDTLETFCRSDFVVKLRLTRLKYSPLSLSQYSLAGKLQVLKHGPLLAGQIRARVELWLERDATCVRNMTRRHPRGGAFLVTGAVQGERLLVSKAYAWQKADKNLMAASRKWRHHRCRS